MKAMLSHDPGGPDTLRLTDLPDPEPGDGQVLVRIRAAGVNFPDTLIIRDLYQMRPPRPFAPGGEVSGDVLICGQDVTGVKTGDRVLAVTGYGGFATQTVVPQGALVPIPDQMPYDTAAAFIFTYGTSYHALYDRAAIKPGETLLVLGAAGGVGSAAIELAKAAGARVIAAVSSPEKAAFCRSLGADETILYPTKPGRAAQKALSDEIKAKTSRQGVDIVYDAVGGDYAEPALRAMAWEGRYLVVGFPAGIPKIPLNLPLLKGVQIIGVFWGDAVRRAPQAHARNMHALFDLYAEGKISPRISAHFPLQDAGHALTQMQRREVTGKLVIVNDASEQ